MRPHRADVPYSRCLQFLHPSCEGAHLPISWMRKQRLRKPHGWQVVEAGFEPCPWAHLQDLPSLPAPQNLRVFLLRVGKSPAKLFWELAHVPLKSPGAW